MSITLYDYWRSSAAYRLRITLNLLGLSYEQIPVDLVKGEHREPDNLARNPQGLVPTLEIDDQTFTQSLAIVEYLDETRDAGLLPADPLGKARVRAISYAIAMEIHPVCNLSVARFGSESSGGKVSMKEWMNVFIPKGLAAVEAMLNQKSTGRYCHGDSISMADICLVPQVYNARRWEVDMTSFTQINRIMAELEKSEAFESAHPDLNK